MQKMWAFFTGVVRFVRRDVAIHCVIWPLLLAGCDGSRDTTAPSAATSDASWQLRSVVVVLRHGVRAPLDSALIARLALGRPIAWHVPDGAITERGRALLEQLGRYDAAWLKTQGVWPTGACPSDDEVIVYANAEARTVVSGQALSRGLAPLCDIPVRSRPAAMGVDPLFRASGRCQITPSSAYQDLEQALGMPTLDSGIRTFRERHRPALNALSNISRPAVVNANGEDGVGIRSLALGTHGSPMQWDDHFRQEKSLASTILFEHANGFPEADLAWGHPLADATREQLTLFLDDYHLFSTGTPYLAQRIGTYLMRSIMAAAKAQAHGEDAERHADRSRNRALFLVGHETSITPLVSLLQTDWQHPRQMSRSPAGGHLVFARWRDLHSSKDYMRVEVIAQTDDQLRALTPLSLARPPLHYPVALPACPDPGPNGMCEMNSFMKWVDSRLAPDCPDYMPFASLVRDPEG